MSSEPYTLITNKNAHKHYRNGRQTVPQHQIVTFAYKNGNRPPESDFVFDCRKLPNPYGISGMANLTGNNVQVRQWLLLKQPVQAFITEALNLIVTTQSNGKDLDIAVGCLGGRHRSVVIANELARRLVRYHDADVTVRHNEL